MPSKDTNFKKETVIGMESRLVLYLYFFFYKNHFNSERWHWSIDSIVGSISNKYAKERRAIILHYFQFIKPSFFSCNHTPIYYSGFQNHFYWRKNIEFCLLKPIHKKLLFFSYLIFPLFVVCRNYGKCFMDPNGVFEHFARKEENRG